MIKFFSLILFLFLVLPIQNVLSLPIDWNGTLSFESNTIGNFRRTSKDCVPSPESYCIAPEDNNARFQMTTFRLNPTLLLSDAATLKGELAMAGSRTGFLGENNNWNQNPGSSYYNIYNNSSLMFNQLYLELYADIALFRIGKFTRHFGMGALVNSGENALDRFYSLYDGIEAQIVVGNLKVTPYWAKIFSSGDLPTGKYDVIETGLELEYKNVNNNLILGALYSIKDSESSSPFYNANGPQNVTLIDIFIQKQWSKIKLEFEVPMLSGKISDFNYNGINNSNFDANAYLTKLQYQSSPNLSFYLQAGMVSGDEGETNNFEALSLHPNFQIARIMYRYNYRGFVDNTQNIFDSSISNSQFLKFNTNYKSGNWDWSLDLITANAIQTAKEGTSYFNQETGTKVASANSNQQSSLGYELDLSFNYEWSRNIFVNGYFGYYAVGEFYKFDNSVNSDLDVSVVTSYGIGLSTKF